MQVETHRERYGDVQVWLPDGFGQAAPGSVPLILQLHWTGGTPQAQVRDNGWDALAGQSGFAMVAPAYPSYDSVYNHTAWFVQLTLEILERHAFLDPGRVYVTGFSNGGAAAVALAEQYPQLYAAIAPQGWMIGMRDWKRNGSLYDMPFQAIQGTDEYTYRTRDGAMAVMRDEQQALGDLMLFNGLCGEDFRPDYKAAAYWGYPGQSVQVLQIDGAEWTVTKYRKAGYRYPLAELILAGGGTHVARRPHAGLAWEFLRHFRREPDGGISELE